jgi:hypothetical protein
MAFDFLKVLLSNYALVIILTVETTLSSVYDNINGRLLGTYRNKAQRHLHPYILHTNLRLDHLSSWMLLNYLINTFNLIWRLDLFGDSSTHRLIYRLLLMKKSFPTFHHTSLPPSLSSNLSN